MTLGRLKTYTAQSGYVYQYRLLRKLPMESAVPSGPNLDFLFEISADRKTAMTLTVVVTPEAIVAWRDASGRELSDSEIHAVAKLRLWRAMDEAPGALGSCDVLRVDAANVVGLLSEIGVD